MTYLTAHRASAVAKYGDNSQRQRPSQLPRPYRPDTRIPGAANDNIRPPANDNFPRPGKSRVLSPKGMRLLTRFPWLIFDVAFEEWFKYNEGRLIETMSPFNPGGQGWQPDVPAVCSALASTHFTQASGFCAAPRTTPAVCFSGSIVSAARGLGEALGTGCRLTVMRHTHSLLGVPRYAATEYWWWDTTVSPVPSGRPLRNPAPRFRPARPVIDPNDLPIYWPVPLPVPIPTVLVPTLLDDPIGSTRNNGDTVPVSPPRRPPPPATKEVKLRAITGVVAIAQKAMHATTELLDHIDSFHDALPDSKKARPKFIKGLGWRKASPQDKVRAVMQNFDALDWNEVIKNVAKNELEDRILGRANAGADRALNRSPIGRITRGFAF